MSTGCVAAEVRVHGRRHHTPEGCEGGLKRIIVVVVARLHDTGPFDLERLIPFLPTPLQIGGKPPKFPLVRV